jgi:hypothetical protein
LRKPYYEYDVAVQFCLRDVGITLALTLCSFGEITICEVKKDIVVFYVVGGWF